MVFCRYGSGDNGIMGMNADVGSAQAKTTKKIVLRLECTECKFRSQHPLKRCKHFELGGDKRKKV